MYEQSMKNELNTSISKPFFFVFPGETFCNIGLLSSLHLAYEFDCSCSKIVPPHYTLMRVLQAS